MKKRGQKLSLHRETLRNLERVAGGNLARAAAGIDTSCTEPCACGDCPDTKPQQFEKFRLEA